jgi:hypothetical protein
MSYVPNNTSVYLRAFAGALAGLGGSGKYLLDPNQGDNVGYALMADAYAQQLDTAWGATAPTSLELFEIQSNSQAVWEQHSPLESHVAYIPSSYTGLVNGVVALAMEGNAQVVSEGIDPNAGGGSGSGTVTDVTGTAPITVTNNTSTPLIAISPATDSTAGSMSAADKTKLDGLSATPNVSGLSGFVTLANFTPGAGVSILAAADITSSKSGIFVAIFTLSFSMSAAGTVSIGIDANSGITATTGGSAGSAIGTFVHAGTTITQTGGGGAGVIANAQFSVAAGAPISAQTVTVTAAFKTTPGTRMGFTLNATLPNLDAVTFSNAIMSGSVVEQ